MKFLGFSIGGGGQPPSSAAPAPGPAAAGTKNIIGTSSPVQLSEPVPVRDKSEMTEDELKAGGHVVTILPPPPPKPAGFHIEPSILENLHRIAEGKTFPKEDRDEVMVVVEEDRAINAYYVQHSADEAKKAWKAQQRGTSELVSSGKQDQVPGDVFTLNDYIQDYHQRRIAIKADRRKIREKVLPVCLRVAKRLGEVAKLEADRMEKEEKAQAKEWGVEFNPSRLLLKLRYIETNSNSLIQHGGAVAPQGALACLGITIE